MTNGEKYKTAQESETVREVCAEMKEMSEKRTLMCCAQDYMSAYSERILSNYDREMVAKDEMIRISVQSAQARFDEELAAKDAEIARLKAALKPVDECPYKQVCNYPKQPCIIVEEETT